MLLFWSAFFGAVASLLLAAYPMACIKCPFDRVAYYLTVLASDLMIAILAYVLLPHIAFISLSTFILSQLLCWSAMNHRNMVHFNLED